MLLRLSHGSGRVEASQFELARLIGMNRSSLRRALASLEECSVVVQQYGALIVRDREALEAFSNEP